jgi:hypothetical protein
VTVESTESADIPAPAETTRCAVHPSRPAVDVCPVCGRPRCGADASEALGGGCRACRGNAGETDIGRFLRSPAERLIAGSLAAFVLGLIGAVIASEYVGAQGFAEIVPFLVGLACSAGAAMAARTSGKGRLDLGVRFIGAIAAVLATALSFRLVPGGQSPFTPLRDVGLPYLAAIVGAALSRLFR